MKKEQATILLGTNIGDKREHIGLANEWISKLCGKLIKSSSIYESEAWGKEDQDSFYNQVIQIKTFLPPVYLMSTLLEIELKLGRIRQEKWGPRIIDLDLLFYNKKVLENKIVTIPHPGIPKRNFTLLPLVEIMPHFIHPVEKKTMTELLDNSMDTLTAKKI